MLAVSVTRDSTLPDDVIVFYDILDTCPTPELMWERLCHAMKAPRNGNPCRPSHIVFCLHEYERQLRHRLNQIGAELRIVDTCRRWDSIFGHLSARLPDADQPIAMVGAPGVRRLRIARLFEAASVFCQKSSLGAMPGWPPIDVKWSRLERERWRAFFGPTLIDQCPGMVLAENIDAVKGPWGRFSSRWDLLRHSVSLQVTLGPAERLAPVDLKAAHEFGWPVASRHSYPRALRINPGGTRRPLLSWELEFLDRCLRTIPDFLTARGHADFVRGAPYRAEVPELDLG